MPRPLQETKIDTRAARERLPPASAPYWREIDPGVHIGYRKGKTKAVWVVRWSVGGGDHRLQTFAQADDFRPADGEQVMTYGQAVAVARHLYREATAPPPPPEPAAPKVYTVRDAVEDYAAWAKKNTKGGRDPRLDAEIVATLGDVAVNDLTARRLAEWRDQIAARGRRLRISKGRDERFAAPPKTKDEIRRRRSAANRTLTILKAVLNMAWRNGAETGVASDQAWRAVEPFENVDAARIRFLTIDEATRLLNACEAEDFRSLVQAALLTGARFSELAAAAVRDFHQDSSTLFIADSKSGRPRYIELTEEGVAFFERMCAGRPGERRIFLRSDGEPWGASHQVRRMGAACTAAKIKPEIGFHILRHTWASLSIMNGMPLMVVAQNLGHADTRMVEKHYGHLARSYKSAMVQAHAPRFGTETAGKVVDLGRRRAAIDRGRVVSLKPKGRT